MGEMTPKEKLTWAMNTLRRASYRLAERDAVKRMARRSRGKYECEDCGELFGPREIKLDHIDPVVDPKTGFTTLDSWLDRLLPGVEGWQVLCKACHDVKTKLENTIRRSYAAERKKRTNKR